MNKYFPNLENGVDNADVTQIIDAFNSVEDDISNIETSSYDDTELRQLIQNEEEARIQSDENIEQQLDEKVDKVLGKGLSTNDFTNEEKEKLDTLEDMVIPTISYSDLDNIYREGIYQVVKDAYTETNINGGYYIEWEKEYFLLIVKYGECFNEDGSRNEDEIYQTLIGNDGRVMKRFTYSSGYWYDDWSEYIPTPSITQQSYISSVSGTNTTYTFNSKGYTSPSAAYKISHTGTNTVMFEFGNPVSTYYTNEILIYFTTELDNAIVWGSDVKFTYDEVPTIEANTYYRIIAEYNPVMKKWVIGVIDDGKGE